MKGETEVASGDSWNSERPDVHCSLYIIHCKLIFRSRNSPLGLKGLGGTGAGATSRRPSGLRVKRFPSFSVQEKCTFAKKLSERAKGVGLKELGSLKWC